MSDELMDRIQREERAERAKLQEHIDSAGGMLKAALPAFDDAIAHVDNKRDKLAALNSRLKGIPAERSALEAEAAKAQRAFEEGVEHGKGLTTLTQDLMAISTKKHELEIMQEALEKKLIPKATQDLKSAEEALENIVASRFGSILESKMDEAAARVEEINAELRGWSIAANDVVAALGLSIYGRVYQTRYKFSKKPAQASGERGQSTKCVGSREMRFWSIG